MKSVLLVASVSAALGLAACGTKSEDASDSSFAHYQAESAFGGPLGRLEAVRQNFQTNFTDIKICVETGKANFTDDQLVFETRLAYAGWLAATAMYDEADWQRFNFVGQTTCDRSDKTIGGFISVLAAANTASISDLDAYEAQSITCTSSAGWKNCSGKGVTLGWGGPGGLTSWYFNSNPNKWTKIEMARASSTTLSPFIDWLPLTEDIKRSKLTEAQKTQLIAAYDALKADQAPTMASLSGFLAKLEAVQLVGAEDPVFGTMAKQFYSANTSTMTKDYRGQYASFSTVLHEVGHQFGMDHAHHPGQDSVTGATSKTTVNEAGQNVTDIGTMAYGLRYNFLTEDDKAGIQSDAKSVREFMTSHK